MTGVLASKRLLQRCPNLLVRREYTVRNRTRSRHVRFSMAE
jgi:hypothetical protein